VRNFGFSCFGLVAYLVFGCISWALSVCEFLGVCCNTEFCGFCDYFVFLVFVRLVVLLFFGSLWFLGVSGV